MDDLLTHIQIDENTYVGKILSEPYISTAVLPAYNMNVRPIENIEKSVQHGVAEVILATGKAIPVTVIGYKQIIPTHQTIQSDEWTPLDEFFYVRANDLTQEQAQEARFFIQRQANNQEKRRD